MSPAPKELGPTARETVDAVSKHLSKASVVLDVGCGPGDLTMAIAQHVASVHAIDASAGMIHVARTRAGRHGVGNVDFAQADLPSVAHRGGTFTAVTALNVLQYLGDVPEAARQIGRLLPPGGMFLSATACLGEQRSFLQVLTVILTRLHIMPETRFFRHTELADSIARGGFQIVATERLSPLPEYLIVARKTPQ